MSNFHKHLLTKHLEQYTALQQIEKEPAQAKTELLVGRKQLTIAQVLENGKLYAFDHPRDRV